MTQSVIASTANFWRLLAFREHNRKLSSFIGGSPLCHAKTLPPQFPESRVIFLPGCTGCFGSFLDHSHRSDILFHYPGPSSQGHTGHTSCPPRWAGTGKPRWLGHTGRLRPPPGTSQGEHPPDCTHTLEKEGQLMQQMIIYKAHAVCLLLARFNTFLISYSLLIFLL